MPALRGVNLGCASGIGSARRSLVDLDQTCPQQRSAGTRTLRRVRGRCGARVWLLLVFFPPLPLCACEVSEAAFDFTPGWEVTGGCFQLDCESWTARRARPPLTFHPNRPSFSTYLFQCIQVNG